MLHPTLRIVERLTAAVEQVGIHFDPEVKLVAVQHLLVTNLVLFDALFRLGLRPKNTYVIGKGYSTCSDVAHALRSRGAHVFPNTEPAPVGGFGESFDRELSVACATVARHAQEGHISRLLVLDDGGRLLNYYCRRPLRRVPIVGVEQTTSGIRRLSGQFHFPIVDVARSVAKLAYESPLIAEAVLTKIAGLVREFSPRTTCGVVGLGPVGKALVSQLQRRGHRVLVAELPEFCQAADVRNTLSFPDILAECDLVFGCTGTNLFHKPDLPSVLRSHVYLASCSSEDIEFAGLIEHWSDFGEYRKWPAPHIEIECQGWHITVIRGGYPVNFDASGESAFSEDIQLTTSLLLAGVVMALLISRSPCSTANMLVQLPAELQDGILRDWFSIAPAVKRFSDEYLVRADLPILTTLSRGKTLTFSECQQIASCLRNSPSCAA